jgi:alkylhydroperoxidase/carboxymuconolactone decarboxylase family protein YurZ
MVAAHAPGLLRDDDRFYESLTRVQRGLAPREREIVWAGLLAAAREVPGFIHMRRAVAAGLNTDDMARAVAIAAVTPASCDPGRRGLRPGTRAGSAPWGGRGRSR